MSNWFGGIPGTERGAVIIFIVLIVAVVILATLCILTGFASELLAGMTMA